MTIQTLTSVWSHATSPLRLLRAVHRFMMISRSRQALRHLDDHILTDIGLTREQAEAEATRPAWDVPPHWRN